MNSSHSLLFHFDNTCIYSKKLLGELEKINQNSSQESAINLEAIKDTITFIIKYHAEQMRKSGEPYYSYPLEVASFVAFYCPKTEIIIAAILHDVVEDTQINNDTIEYFFGDEVVKLVNMLTDLTNDIKKLKPDKSLLLYKKIKTFDKDASLIKVCDRLHNMRTIGSMKGKKQIKKALETLQTYVLMAKEIGIFDLASELEELSRKILSSY